MAVLGYLGLSGVVMWALWCYLKLFEFIWGKLDLSGGYLGLSGLSGPIWSSAQSVELSVALWDSLGLAGAIWVLQAIWLCLGLSEPS